MNYKYFTKAELTCKCGCGKADMDEDFMEVIEEIRETLGFPFIVTSAYRCPEYNNKVSTTGYTGPHTTGKAMDISVSHENAYHLVAEALANKFKGVGVNQKGSGRFIHLDMISSNQGPRPRIWSY